MEKDRRLTLAKMVKIFLVVFTALMMVGCDDVRPSKEVDGAEIVTIDSCEYVRCLTYYGHIVDSHKGNCRFCTERRKKELKELVEQLKGK